MVYSITETTPVNGLPPLSLPKLSVGTDEGAEAALNERGTGTALLPWPECLLENCRIKQPKEAST